MGRKKVRTMSNVCSPQDVATLPPASPAPVGTGPLDPLAIERLRELDPSGQQGMLGRVLQAYHTSLSRHLQDLGGTDLSLKQLASATHTLKSSSAAVGAMAFSQRCADIEQLVRREQRQPPSGDLDALLQEGRHVLEAVTAMLTQ